VHISQGKKLLLTSSATVYSIDISEGGKPISPPQSPTMVQVTMTSDGQNKYFILWVYVRARVFEITTNMEHLGMS
jgi:hypothetical protein